MSKLEWALAWARRGFPVFPLTPNGKEPLSGSSWTEISTTDEATIRRLWTDPVLGVEYDYNIGVDTTGHIVPDVDVKDGKDGYNEYNQITGGAGWDTLTVRTPTGGYHLYFEGAGDYSLSPISPGVDVRAYHGYVVGPGSTIDGRAYEIVRDVELAWVPASIEAKLTPRYADRTADTRRSMADTEAAIRAGINYLETAPPAVEGQRGDDTTYQVAARLTRELGISVEAATWLMWEHYNPRCEPPWSLDELSQKVENAAKYATATLGRIEAETVFGGLAIPAVPSAVLPAGVEWGNALLPEATPARPWMLDRMLIAGETTLMIAAGSVGKSLIGLTLAAHLALGRDFGGYKMHVRARSLVYNGEDDVAEMSRRLQAICLVYGFDFHEVRKHVRLLDEHDMPLTLVQRGQGGALIENQVAIEQLTTALADPSVGLFVGDPLGDLHDADENDPAQMNGLMRVIKRISRQANVASLVMAHSTKSRSDNDDRVGNMNILRGTSAIVYKARLAFTLHNMLDKDVEDYGMQAHEQRLYMRMDDAKMNITLQGDQVMWFKREGVRITSKDIVGVLKDAKLEKSITHLKVRLATILVQAMMETNTATLTITQAVGYIKEREPLYGNKTDTEIKQKLDSMFSTMFEYQGKRLQIRREKDKPIVVLS